MDLPVNRPTPPAPDRPGPMAATSVVELADPFCSYAGKLLADAGADVIVVEPPGGAAQRSRGPFADEVPGPENSLVWWAENTSKRSIVLDLDSDEGRRDLRRLVARADVVLEATRPGWLAARSLDEPDLRGGHPDRVWCSMTPFGRDDPRSLRPATDLTILAAGGPVWSCGYDDHAIPPVRGGGDQGFRIAGHFAVMSILTALLARARHGGQHIDLSMHAAANVTTEFASYGWLAAQQTVQRQTGRHATPNPTDPTQVRCADGRWLNTGVPPRRPGEFKILYDWLAELDLVDEFPMASLLEMGGEYEYISLQMIQEDPMVGEVFGAGRDAVELIASKLSAHDAFVGFQQRGIAVGVIWSPDEVMNDPHFVERGFRTEVVHEDRGEPVVYPGPPIRFAESPTRIRSRAPRIGEHTEEILRSLDDA